MALTHHTVGGPVKNDQGGYTTLAIPDTQVETVYKMSMTGH